MTKSTFQNLKSRKVSEYAFKTGANEETLLQKQLQEAKKYFFWKISKIVFAFKTQVLCLQHVLSEGANEKTFAKH